MLVDYDEIAREWAAKVPDGQPILSNPHHKDRLREVLIKLGYPLYLLGEETLDEADRPSRDTILKQKITNPKTNRQIKVATGLSYGKGHAAYPPAKAAFTDVG